MIKIRGYVLDSDGKRVQELEGTVEAIKGGWKVIYNEPIQADPNDTVINYFKFGDDGHDPN